MKEILFAIGMLVTTDGDTLRAGDLRIRIWGLDCAEMNTREGRRSKSVAERYLQDNPVSCVDIGQSSYNRKVYRCDNFAIHMIKHGGCKEWCRYSKGYYGGQTCQR